MLLPVSDVLSFFPSSSHVTSQSWLLFSPHKHVSSKLVASTFWCLVDSVVGSVHKKLGTPISKPFANAICKLLSHEHFLMSKLKRAHDHLQKAISSH